ncbi:MAG: spermidine/putrescine ABC transporter substrate-binding protein [Microthrixaceae bacterium]
MAGTLGACSKEPEGQQVLRIANWTDYIDPGPDGTVARFEQATGIKVEYSETIEDNYSYFNKMVPTMAAGKAMDADLIMPTSDMAARLIGLGWAEPIPTELVPNAENLVPELTNRPTDPLGRYTLPWASGTTVIAYNRAATGFDVATIDDLFDERLKGRVYMLSEFSDPLGMVGLAEGVDITTPRLAKFTSTFERLEEATRSGQIAAYVDEYLDELESEEFAAGLGWGGDVALRMADNPDLQMVIPESGGIAYTEVMLIPKGSPNVEAAAAFMNFVYEPENAAKLTAYVQYKSPVQGVPDLLRAMGPEEAAVADDPMVFPDEKTQERLYPFGVVSPNEQTDFEDRFNELVALTV